MEKGAVFPLFYLPSIEYITKMIVFKNNLIIENAENFQKQSYRNRAIIHAPNGPLNLIIPVAKGSKNQTPFKEVKISYDFDWQRIHWMTLQTSYRRSAYFEFYEDELVNFYQKKWNFLFDYNEDFLNLIFRFFKIELNYTFTDSFHETYKNIEDYRYSIHPKQVSTKKFHSYYQVFEEKNGFLPNLSIVDLIFNQGPQSIKYL